MVVEKISEKLEFGETLLRIWENVYEASKNIWENFEKILVTNFEEKTLKIIFPKTLRKSEECFKNFEINFEDDFERNLSKFWANFEKFWKKYILRVF